MVATVGSVAAGDVTFKVTNTGPEDVHEFVILKTDLDPAALPTDETGAVTEDAEGIEVVDEIEDVAVGQTQEVTTSLAAGAYVLFCNIYSEAENEAHYRMGNAIRLHRDALGPRAGCRSIGRTRPGGARATGTIVA